MYIAKDKPAIAGILLFLKEKKTNVQMTELFQLHFFQHPTGISPKQVLAAFMLSRNKKKQKKKKVIWKERSAHSGAPARIAPALCEKKAGAPLQYDIP